MQFRRTLIRFFSPRSRRCGQFLFIHTGRSATKRRTLHTRPWPLNLAVTFPAAALAYVSNLSGSWPPPRYAYDPSVFAFRSLSTVPPRSPLTPQEEVA
ncbi:hypothetical protein SKAU_G00303060 [Synaphobranchus kaupii]|uniref:Uncharacterized protein n=1 Tax=Synaphobranchus kaupii TaxID=118154 RepID=A0A9Q1EW30_SYNKA|nr:hypothetical protein SKAU_G00303030 [Synaphobranchus kaupii]KAJ8346113.1 hypothetical protein SKAU_G00303060 [Synaphobranchus kaupii]